MPATQPSTLVTIDGVALPAAQANTIAFEDALNADGTLNTANFWNWSGTTPATYGSMINGQTSIYGTAHKWGNGTVGTGSTITYAFDPGSNWTAGQQQGLAAAMQIWSDETNVTFVPAASGATPDFTFYRNGTTTPNAPVAAGFADTTLGFTNGAPGTTQAGSALQGAAVSIDTAGFGEPDDYTTYAGYGITTALHELGHIIGLGHTGPYNGTVDSATQQFSPYDNRQYSLMSYIDPFDPTSAYYSQEPVTGSNWGVADGYYREPHTPMMDDIIAAQQLDGAPVTGALTQTQTFGFDSTITDATAFYFDFDQDPNPVVTLFDTAPGNTLDLSGFASTNTVNLNPGSFSSADGLTNNIGIAYGTRIDNYLGGAGNDTVTLNFDTDHIDGGAGGADTVILAAGRLQYQIGYVGHGQTQLAGDGQSATLLNIGTIRFADGSQVQAPTSYAEIWDGGAGDFATDAQWQSGIAPFSGSDVSISEGAVSLTTAATIASLQLAAGSTLAITGSLTVTGDATPSMLDGTLAITAAGTLDLATTLDGSGTITGAVTLAGGTIGAGLTLASGTVSGNGLIDSATAAISVASVGGILTLGQQAAGTLSVGANTRLALQAGAAAGTTLTLAQLSYVDIASGQSFTGVVNGLSTANGLDFHGQTATVAYGQGTAIVSAGNQVIGTLALTPPSGTSVQAVSDGAGGTLIDLQPTPISPANISLAIYRFYDALTEGHLFSISLSEIANFLQSTPGLINEGIAFSSINPTTDPSAVPVYRFLQNQTGGDFYTDSQQELNTILQTRPDMTYQGVGFTADAVSQPGDATVYRFLETRSGGHFYTDSAAEANQVLATRPDMTPEGTAFFVKA